MERKNITTRELIESICQVTKPDPRGKTASTVIRLLTPLGRTVPILAVRPASRRLSTKVRIFIEHLEKPFALCSQFNPRPS